MAVDELVKRLGYERSPNFLRKSEFGSVPGYSHLFERGAKGRCRLRGVYVLKEDSIDGGTNVVPLVYVCEEGGESTAQEIHRLAWNQNVVPFVLVAERDVVRLYSGFSYSTPTQRGAEDGHREGVLRASVSFNRISMELRSLGADAIDRGDVWREWESRINPKGRVDWTLLDNLNKLGTWLRDHHLPKGTAHALIGKYVYLRYLRDRDILSNRKFAEWELDPGTVFGRGATLAGLRAVTAALEEWLNGSVFPLKLTGADAPTPEHLAKVAGAFMGDDPESGQLHLDFQPYDFSHIPIETLSVIYEQFLHAEGKGRDAGAYYTPVPLVNFMLQELEDHSPLRPGMKVLDGSCGSGAFLVQCYRRLIERRLREGKEDKLTPKQLRELLVESIFGVDRDEDACRVAELSLVLTLLDYIDPPDLRSNPKFKIPALHDKNIFHSDFFSPRCPIRETDKTARFDWVVGNPPWVEVKEKDKDDPEDLNRYVRDWLTRKEKSHPTGGNQAAQAFAWKLGGLLKPDGCAALLLPAKTLFNYECQAFRQEFFSRHTVWCVANFSNLREVLFANRSRDPAAAYYFSLTNDAEQPGDGDTLTYSPMVANQEANRPVDPNTRKDTWNIVINASEIRRIPRVEAVKGDLLTWKVAMWGSPRDERLLRTTRKKFPSLRRLCKDHGLEVAQGFELRENAPRGVEFLEDLVGKKILVMESLRRCGRIYNLPDDAIGIIPRDGAYLRTRGGRKGLIVSRPPHVIIDEARRFAVYSEEFIGIPPRQIGISGKPKDAKLLKALSLFLVSDFANYYQFMVSPAWGVKGEIATLRSLKEVPIPFSDLSDAELSRWERLHTDAVRHRADQPDLYDPDTEGRKTANDIDREINDLTYAALGLSDGERWLVEDLWHVRIELDEGKLGQRAIAPPSEDELKAYGEALSAELDLFLGDKDKRHEVRVVHDGRSGMVQTRIWKAGRADGWVTIVRADGPTSEAFAKSRKLIRRDYTQWVYFDRKLVILDGEMTYLFKPLQRFHWTRGQALNDADLIIGDTITAGGG